MMDKRLIRLVGWTLVWVVGCALWWWGSEPTAIAATGQWTVPPVAPILINGSFECANGFVKTQNAAGKDIWIPNGWTVNFIEGSPRLLSTRMSESRSENCQFQGGHVTRQEGNDSWYIPSQDIATPPLPGKPFDLVLYQQIAATYGGAYSLSGWMTSECGDDENGANPCPDDYYVAKMIGIDPNGGIDPNSSAIEWVENREDRYWQNLYTSATALTGKITVFIRIVSPFQFHNNKGFVDAFTLLRSPLSGMNTPVVEGVGKVLLTWFGQQSQDVNNIPGGKFELRYDVQTRARPNGSWRFVMENTEAESTYFNAPCLEKRYEFRVRARAEQPEGSKGSSPDHSYFGVWTKPQAVTFDLPPAVPITNTIVLSPTLFLPMTARTTFEEC